MIAQIIIAGFSLGAIGSLHCVGMCGPLSLALPVHQFSPQKKILALLLYQFGRIFTYSFIGLILGVAGRRIYLSGLQQWFSVLSGIVVVALVAQYWVFKKSGQVFFLKGFYNYVQNAILFFLRSNKIINYFMLGAANGLLPCGMVYVAVAAALTTSSVFNSVVFMAFFGTGTLPAMLAVGYFGQFFTLSIRNHFKKALPVLATIIGVILILRGLNLAIPFISPALPHAPGQVVSCH
ncbi:MAG: sulfite exporter TauE/SafE family protein [Bacteroidetes bacterium]|nr:sulfite exporter TauE/SafE family protein [Bacteroidota bacterium]